jgi:hypothetical protein
MKAGSSHEVLASKNITPDQAGLGLGRTTLQAGRNKSQQGHGPWLVSLHHSRPKADGLDGSYQDK